MANNDTTDTAKTDTLAKQPKDDPERVVDVIVTRFTSLGSQFFSPGKHRMRLSQARHMQAQGLAHPPPKVVDAVKAVPDKETGGSEDAEGIDDEDKGDGSEGE